MQADQNNDGYKPDEQFTNRGWAVMQEKLDKEMPEERKKRKGVIWFYFLGALILAGGIWFFNDKNPQVLVVEKEQKVYAEKTLKNKNDNQIIKNIKDENRLTLEKGLATKNETNKLITIEKQKSTVQNRYNNIKSGNELFNNIPNNSSIPFNNIASKSIVEEVKLEPSNLIENINNGNNTNVEREATMLSSISFLKTLLEEKEQILHVIEEDLLANRKSEIVETIQPKKRDIELGMNVGVLLDLEHNKKIGGVTGAQIHFPLGKKLGIRTGLGYALINKKLYYSYSDVQNASYLDPNAIATPTPNYVNYIEVTTNNLFKLERFHYLEVPLLLTYSPHRKWELQVGVNTSFLFRDNLTSIYSDFGFIDQDIASNQGIELANINEESVDLDGFRKQDFWNKWNASSILGISYKLNNRWNLGFQYHRSFSRFLKTNDEGIFEYDSFGAFDPLLNLGADPSFSVQNELNEARFLSTAISTEKNDISKIKNVNHSLRLTIGYSF